MLNLQVDCFEELIFDDFVCKVQNLLDLCLRVIVKGKPLNLEKKLHQCSICFVINLWIIQTKL